MPPDRPGVDRGRDVGDDAEDRRAALALVAVSRETEDRFALYADRLRAWQRIKNLVAPSTLDRLWSRHLADSAQLLALAPGARRWADLGSGAGFPGLVIALMLHDDNAAQVHLIESNARKCAFLRDVVRLTEAPAVVHNARVEDALPQIRNIDVVTSRALAPLPALIAMSRSLLDCGAMGLFLSGEHTDIGSRDSVGTGYDVEAIPSRTHAEARILRVRRSVADQSPV